MKKVILSNTIRRFAEIGGGRSEKKPLNACQKVQLEATLERIKTVGPKNPIEFQIAHKDRELFSLKTFPYGIREDKDARNLVKLLLPGERKLVFDALRKRTVDQYMEHKRLGNAEVHSEDLVKIWYIYFIPTFCFAFVDNAFLIIFGEEFDEHFGSALGLSIIGGAAVANIFVNLMGMNVGIHTEKVMKFFGTKRPILSAEQWNNRQVRGLIYLAKIIGILVGCTCGMIPLVFYNSPTRSDIMEKETVEVDVPAVDEEEIGGDSAKKASPVDYLSQLLFSAPSSHRSIDLLNGQILQDLSDDYKQQMFGARPSDKGI